MCDQFDLRTTSNSMKNFIFYIIIIFCITATAVHTVTIACTFDWSSWNYVTGLFYRCDAQNKEDFNGSLISIDAAVGVHRENQANDDVTEFRLHDSPNLMHFPKNLDSVFPDLEAIVIYDSRLQAITQDDLKVFPRLNLLVLVQNELRVIAADTFRANPKLQRVDLDSNMIFHIEPHAFDGLRKLAVLSIRGNDDDCHLTATTTRNETLQMIEKINDKSCFSRVYELEQENVKLMQENVKLKQQVEEMKVLMSRMLVHIETLNKTAEIYATTKNDSTENSDTKQCV
jgi:hypothetical protein